MDRKTELREDGLAELEREPHMDVAGIGVPVHKGVATFKRSDSHCNEEAPTKRVGQHDQGADELAGGHEVKPPDINPLTNNGPPPLRQTRWVKRSGINRQNDSELAAAAVEAIQWLTTIPQETIRVTARDGWLHMEGTLSSWSQRNTVEDVTRHLPGVKGVTDSITITASAARSGLRAFL